MRPKLLLALICAAIAGCPKTPADDEGGSAAGPTNCSPLDGTYTFTYTQRSGNCGAQPSEVLVFVNGVSRTNPAATCQSGGEVMSSACDLVRDRTCAVSDPVTGSLLGHTRVSGTLSEVNDNTRVEGTLDASIVDTTGRTCQSTYDVVGVRN